jgi:hypothetical protein
MSYKLIPKGYYVLWLTCLVSDYENRLCAALVKKGYAVSSGSEDGSTTLGTNENPSYLLTLKLYSGKKDLTSALVHKDVLDVIVEESMYVYSSVVAEMSESSWYGSNILLPIKKTTPLLTNPEPNKKLN